MLLRKNGIQWFLKVCRLFKETFATENELSAIMNRKLRNISTLDLVNRVSKYTEIDIEAVQKDYAHYALTTKKLDATLLKFVHCTSSTETFLSGFQYCLTVMANRTQKALYQYLRIFIMPSRREKSFSTVPSLDQRYCVLH